jgi:hypothetical protein
MERYSGLFYRGNQTKMFRAWHPEWLQANVVVSIDDDSLLTTKFDWFKRAQFVGATFAPGFKQVSLGHVHSLERARQSHKGHHGTSAFFEMP